MSTIANRSHRARTISMATLCIASALALAQLGQALPATPQAPAQCQPSWIPTFGGSPGVDGDVYALAQFDDGSGSALYVGGSFVHAGGVLASMLAKWDGSNWTPMNNAQLGVVHALVVFDDGSGPALYAGGSFGVAKRVGANWSFLSTVVGTVYALEGFDDGNGPALYAGGAFSSASSVSVSNFAKWNGSAWSSVGPPVPLGPPGLGGGSGANSVRSLVVFDDGSGPALYVGGSFTNAGTTPCNNVAKWDGSFWSPLSTGIGNRVNALAVFDRGSGDELYAGCSTLGGGASTVARWTGVGWAPLAIGPTGDVHALRSFNDGNGRALFVGGAFATAGAQAASCMARWTGTSWFPLGTGIGTNPQVTVFALASFDDGHGKALYVGGSFAQAGGSPAICIAAWTGTAWSPLGHGLANGVSALTTYDDGSGTALIAGGSFVGAGGTTASHVAKWNGAQWSALGSGLTGSSSPNVHALAAFDDGSGAALYAGGRFTDAGGSAANHIAKWDGSSWSALGTGLSGANDPTVYALTTFDDGTGNALYVGGQYASAGGVVANNVARWDGSTWSALGTGIGGSVAALAVFDDGTGPALYAGGIFPTAGGAPAQNIAKWNGTSWSSLNSPMTGNSSTIVRALAVFDDGGGPALYVGGSFISVAGVTTNYIAKWNGSAWSALGSGVGGAVLALTVFDDGAGPALYAIGTFPIAGGVLAKNIARWNGSAWSPLGQGLNYAFFLSALTTFDDSSGPALYAGGFFVSAPDSHDSYIAKWGCPFVSSGVTYCTTSTTTNGCVPVISATGSASASASSGFTITVANLESHRHGLVFYGIHGPLASPWSAGGSSTLCVKAPLQRMHAFDSGGSPGLCNGLISEDWNLFVATHASALGQPFTGGETVWAQGWFRDPPSTKTTALSNGLVFSVAP